MITCCPDNPTLVFSGIQTLLHVFSLLCTEGKALDEFYTETQRAYLLYLEYAERVYLKTGDSVHPSTFVYQRVFGEKMGDHRPCSRFTILLGFITHFLLLGKTGALSWKESQSIIEEFLQDYIVQFLLNPVVDEWTNDVMLKLEIFMEKVVDRIPSKENTYGMCRKIYGEILMSGREKSWSKVSAYDTFYGAVAGERFQEKVEEFFETGDAKMLVNSVLFYTVEDFNPHSG
jgi:hypothetical protein